MNPIFLAAAVAGLIYVMFWMIKNDRAKTIDGQRGWLRMKSTVGTAAPARQKVRERRSVSEHPQPGPKIRGGAVPRSRDLPRLIKEGSIAEQDLPESAEEEIIHPLYKKRRGDSHRPR